MKLNQLYQERAQQFEETAQSLRAKYIRFSIIRLLIFVIGIGLIVYLFTLSAIAGSISILVFLLAFAKFVKWHQEIQRNQNLNQDLSTLNTYEIAALDNDYSNFEDGVDFQDVNHPYSIDLDIFGPFSFFQYCNRTSTSIGQACLAKYLTHVASKDEIILRQNSVIELQEKLNWRQHFQALGLTAEDKAEHVRLLKSWLKDPPFVSNNKVYQLAILLTPFWVILAAVASVLWIPWQLGLFFYWSLPTF